MEERNEYRDQLSALRMEFGVWKRGEGKRVSWIQKELDSYRAADPRVGSLVTADRLEGVNRWNRTTGTQTDNLKQPSPAPRDTTTAGVQTTEVAIPPLLPPAKPQVVVKSAGLQTDTPTYASVLAQTEGREEEGLQTTDDMELDPPSSPPLPAVTPTAKDLSEFTTPAHTARAFVVHGIACTGPFTHKVQEVERAFRGKGGGVIGVRWLLQWNRRRGKTASSMVVFLRKAVPTAVEMAVRMRGRKYTVVEYEWGRRSAGVASW